MYAETANLELIINLITAAAQSQGWNYSRTDTGLCYHSLSPLLNAITEKTRHLHFKQSAVIYCRET